MSSITIRGTDEALAANLRQASARSGQSINKLVLLALREKYGTASQPRRFSDLDHLAGTWSQADLEDFNQAVSSFDHIDPRDWQ